MTCMVPMPPSQARMADCQPLSCHAVAYISFAGILICGALAQKVWPAALSRAVLTSSLGALVPLYEGLQPGGTGLGEGGGGSAVSFGLARGLLVRGLGVGDFDGVFDGVGDGVGLGASDG